MSQTNRKYERLESLLSSAPAARPDPLRPSAPRELDRLKAQVAELQARLAEREPQAAPAPADSQERLLPPAPVEAPAEAASGVPKPLATWVAAIFIGVSLAFFSFFTYNLFISQKGVPDESDRFLLPQLVFMLAASLAAWVLIRRDRYGAGVWLLFVANVLLPPVGVVLVLSGIGGFALLYLVLLSGILIARILPKPAVNRAMAAASLAILAVIGIEWWNPAYRMETETVRGFTGVVTVLAVLVLMAFILRQAITGSIRSKLITALLGVAGLSMGAIALTAQSSLSSGLTTNIGVNLAGLASSRSTEIGLALDRELQAIELLALDEAVQDAAVAARRKAPLAQAEIDRIDQAWQAGTSDNLLITSILGNPLSYKLREFQAQFPQHAEVFLTDPQGLLIGSTNLTSDYYQADEEWWQRASEDGIFIGQPEYDESSKTTAINMAVLIRQSGNERTLGVLRTTVNFTALTEFLRAGLFGETGRTLIYLPDGRTLMLVSVGGGGYELAETEAPIEIKQLALSPLVYEKLLLDEIPTLASKAVVGLPGDSGRHAEVIGNLNWRAVSLQDESEALAPVTAQTRNLLFLFGLIAALVVAAAYFLSRLITNPLLHLNEAARQVAGGDLAAQARVESRDEVGALAATFNSMTAQLRGMIGSLEQRVADRTHDLELATEVGRTITQKVNRFEEMLTEAAEMIRARFNLYYTQVYLTDPARRTLTLRAGTGEAGRELLKRGHRLTIDSRSLNGQAVMLKKPVIVADTSGNPAFKPNPLLPETRSEMAVPLIAGDQVIGVLDMQSERPGALNEAGLPAFEALAGQLAVALQNASLFTQAEEARAEVEAQMRGLTGRGWESFLDAIERGQRIGFTHAGERVVPLEESGEAAAEAVSVPIEVTGARVGSIRVPRREEEPLTADERDLLQAAAAQLARHLENLRLLSQAEGYRAEAEQALRRMTREGWDLLQLRSDLPAGYLFDRNEVRPLSGPATGGLNGGLKKPLTVRQETIGEMVVDAPPSEEAAEIVEAVARQLSAHIENLRLSEQNEKRALELGTVADLSATTSTVLEPQRLLQSVADMTKDSFGVYHAHIYVMDEARDALALAAGAGETGRRMAAEGHAIPLDAERSLVARAARERTAVIVNDVRADPGFLPNPLLPETRSEMAVPMIVGGQVLGVFDVQADRAGHFTDEDASIYTTLGSQVGVALQNARLYAEQAATVSQLRELDRLKSSFLANMSHELRTPLNSILGFADVMLEELDGPLTDTMQNDLGLIQKNGQHLLHLINDVLDMAKIEAGRMNLNPEKFRVHEILEEVTSITSTLASEKNLSLFIAEGSDREVEITADRTRLRQVMINLVNNAIKFTERGGISMHAACRDGHVLIRVRDSGIGIPADKLEEVFQEFAQVDSSTTRKTGGTGLGLPISRRLIEMHGGRLWAESSGIENEGSTFHVELPLTAEIAEAVEAVAR